MSIIAVFAIDQLQCFFAHPMHEGAYARIVQFGQTVDKLRLVNNYMLIFDGAIGIVWDDPQYGVYHDEFIKVVRRLICNPSLHHSIRELVDNFNDNQHIRQSYHPPHTHICMPEININIHSDTRFMVAIVAFLVIFFGLLSV